MQGSISLSHINLTYKSLKTGQPSYLRFILSFPSHRCTRSSSPIALSHPYLTSRLNTGTRSYYHSAFVLWNNLIYVRLLITSLLQFQTRLCLIFQVIYSLSNFTLPLRLSLYSPRLCHETQEWYFRYWPSFVFSSHTHFVYIHRHIIHANVYDSWLVIVYE